MKTGWNTSLTAELAHVSMEDQLTWADSMPQLSHVALSRVHLPPWPEDQLHFPPLDSRSSGKQAHSCYCFFCCCWPLAMLQSLISIGQTQGGEIEVTGVPFGGKTCEITWQRVRIQEVVKSEVTMIQSATGTFLILSITWFSIVFQ